MGRLRSSRIQDVAAAFCDLQEARERADYDHLAPFAKADVLGVIQDAERAIQMLGQASSAEREGLFALPALRTSIP